MSTGASVTIAFQTDKNADEYARLGVAAEAYGFDGVSVFADLGFQPPWQALAVMARHTSRVRLGPACVNPFTTHPIDIAAHAVTLDRFSGGRSYVGITKGTWLDQLGLHPQSVADALVDSVEIVRRVVAGDTAGYEGKVFRLAEGFALRLEREREAIPVLVGAWGPQAVATAGRVADELKVGGTANPALVPVMRERLEVGARAVERRATDIAMAFGAVTVVDRDGAAARRLARTEVAMYLAVLADLDPTTELPEGLVGDIRQLVAADDHEGAGRLIPDEVLARFAFAGTPEEITAHACRLFDAGLDRIEFGTPHGVVPLEGVELLGTRVLPALHEAIGR